MRDLAFSLGAPRTVRHAIAPAIALDLTVAGAGIRSALVQCQVLVEPGAALDDGARAELFGSGPVRPLVWTHAAAALGADGRAQLLLPVPVDFAHAAAKLFAAARDDLPIVVQLSGTVFHGAPLQVAPIPRDRELRTRLPLAVYRETVAHYFPHAAPLALRRDTFDALHAYRRAQGLATADDAIDRLLARGPQ